MATMTELANVQPMHAVRADFSREQLELLKTSFGSPLSAGELSYFVEVCKRTGLDPFRKQIYAVKRFDKRAGRERMAIQTGIDGFRTIASRSGLYDGQDEPMWCGKDGVWRDVWLAKEPPAAAKVGVYRRGFVKPIVAVARFDSYAQDSPMWRTMPEVMIAKCAEALALRKAFPEDVSGLYADAEMAQMAQADNDQDVPDRQAPSPAPNAAPQRVGTTAALTSEGEMARRESDTRRIDLSPAEAPKSRHISHDPETGEIDSDVPFDLYRERAVALGRSTTLADLQLFWQCCGDDKRKGALSAAQYKQLGELKDLRKHEIQNPPPAEPPPNAGDAWEEP